MTERYTNPADPAATAQALLAHMQSAAPPPGSRFVYRGQTREYPAPLIPSAYRGLLDERGPRSIAPRGTHPALEYVRVFCPAQILTYAAVLIRQGMRQLGSSNPDYAKWSQIDPYDLSANDILFAGSVTDMDPRYLLGLPPDASPHVLTTEQIDCMKAIRDYVPAIVSNADKQIIRQLLLVNELGRPAGDLLAQQYGLTSSFLDGTLSLEVAGFFATHGPPEYSRPVETDEPGVIYRFEMRPCAQAGEASDLRSMQFLAYDEVLAHYEDVSASRNTTLRDLINSIRQYGTIASMPKHLRLPSGAISNSRVGRQASVMIVPHALTSPDGLLVMGVEDLRSRHGFRAFYFRHAPAKGMPSAISRSKLWPLLGDAFRNGLQSSLAERRPTMFVSNIDGCLYLPNRPELIDTGYCFSKFPPDFQYLGARPINKKLQHESEEVRKTIMDAEKALRAYVFDGTDASQVGVFGANSKRTFDLILDVGYCGNVELSDLKAVALHAGALISWVTARRDMATDSLDLCAHFFFLSSVAHEIAGHRKAARHVVVEFAILVLQEAGKFPTWVQSTDGLDWITRCAALLDEAITDLSYACRSTDLPRMAALEALQELARDPLGNLPVRHTPYRNYYHHVAIIFGSNSESL